MTITPRYDLEYFKKRLYYNQYTGLFIYLIPVMQMRPGDIAGSPNTNGHIQIMIDKIYYMAHNLAWFYMTGEWPQNIVDHKDRNYSNNKWENLRPATFSQNQGNTKIRKDNKTGYKGVHFDKRSNKFVAQITIYNKRTWLGTRETAEEAFKIYLEAANKHFGEFHNAN